MSLATAEKQYYTYDNPENFRAALENLFNSERQVTLQINHMMAEIMLEYNTGNRPLSEKRVQTQAADMSAGKWYLTGETIIFSRPPVVLNNGQHRLKAQLRATRPFVTDVRFGIERAAYMVTDTGKKRSTSDALSINGEKQAATMASAIGWIYRYQQGLPESARDACDIPTTLRLLEQHPGIRHSVDVALQTTRSYPGFQAGPMGFAHYAMAQRDLDDADAFFLKVETGFDISDRNDPFYRLRQRMSQVYTSRLLLRPEDQIALTFKAWNAWRAGKPMGQLAWRGEGPQAEPYPEPV